MNLKSGKKMKNYWLVKQEPETYSWETFWKDGKAVWSGIRNYQARNNLRAMKPGDPVVYYHSVSEKRAVGIAKVSKAAYPDPTAAEGDWSAVEIVPVKTLVSPVSLETIKADPVLKELPLVKNSRLSVSPVSEAQYRRLLELAGTS